jgi:co-chaperonin GroES (HSP10)
MAGINALRAAEISDLAADHFNNPETAGKLFIPEVSRDALSTARGNAVGYHYRSVEEAFPPVDPGLQPFGNLVLVQLRYAMKVTGGGIIVDPETRRTEQDNTQVARVVALGPLAFRNRNTGELWPEGAWCGPGDFVRVPKYQGDRFIKPYFYPDRRFDMAKQAWTETGSTVKDDVEFVLFKDLAILGRFTTDPLAERSHL